MNRHKKSIIYFSGIIILAAAFFINNSCDPVENGVASDKDLVIGNDKPMQQAEFDAEKTGEAFAVVAEDVLPTVTSISTSQIIERPQGGRKFFGPLLRDFFGDEFDFNIPEKERQQGLGSGVLVSNKGHILTNNHVVQNADDISVKLYDHREFSAKLVGTDPLTEVAVIQIQGDDLPLARLGNSEELKIGEWVLAIGNPLYLTSTVTAGIVSAKGRSIGIIRNEQQSGGSYAIENFIQTDAAINPGNSGGALVNLQGEVIGINTAIASRTGGYQGYGFAVPINLAKKIMNDLIEQGYVTRAWLGISMRPVDKAVSKRFNLDKPKGVLVDRVMEDSPAENAGLQSLDIILELDGETMDRTNEVQNAIALKDPGEKVDITVLRDGQRKSITVELGQRDTDRGKVSRQEETEVTNLGISVENLNQQIRKQTGYQEDGVIVSEVKRYGPAFEAGIRRGDLITAIENNEISSIEEYNSAVNKIEQGSVAIFDVKRNDSSFHAFVQFPEE